MPETIAEYRAKKYHNYVIAQERYNMYYKFSDLLDMLDNGIAVNMFSQEELKEIINKQDELVQRILLCQYGKYITVE